MKEKTYTLSNGVSIPKLGLGTWFIDNSKAAKAVCDAVSLGYRHIDTAQAYGNEEGVGQGIRTCGINRSDIFVTTKVAAEAKSYQSAADSIDTSLKTMGLDYIDMMIIHSPQPWAEFRESHRYFEENREVWRALEDAYTAGKLRAIGVSNFLEDDLENIMNSCRIQPMTNQILAHISNTPFSLIKFCQAHHILVEAYSPIAHGEMLNNEEIIRMANRYQVTPAQLCIQYVLQLQMVALPKTANPDHMKTNFSLDFEIQTEDMEILQAIKPIENYGEHSIFPVFSGKQQK